MKSLALFAVLLLCVNLSLQLTKLVNCPSDFVPDESMANQCAVLTCHTSTGHFSSLGCDTRFCQPGSYVEYKQPDNSKPYPDCCGGPICKDPKNGDH